MPRLEAPNYRGRPAAYVERVDGVTRYGFTSIGRTSGAGWIVYPPHNADEETAKRFALGNLQHMADGEDRPKFRAWARIVSHWTRDMLKGN